MFIRRLLYPAVCLVALTGLLGTPQKADAGLLMLTVSQAGAAGSPRMITDGVFNGGLGDLDGVVNNIIVASGTLGSWAYTLNVVTTFPGTAAMATMTVTVTTAQRLNTTNPAPLVLEAFQLDFTGPGSSGSTVQMQSSVGSSSIGVPTTNNIVVDNFIGLPLTSPGSHVINAPGGPSNLPPILFMRGASFQLRSMSTINLANVTSANFNTLITVIPIATPTPIPEPASLALVLSGVPVALGCYLRRRRTWPWQRSVEGRSPAV